VGSATGDAEDLVVIAFCHYPSKLIMPPKVSREPLIIVGWLNREPKFPVSVESEYHCPQILL
jgi:hypothetical protein